MLSKAGNFNMTTRSAAAQRVGFATPRIQPNLMQTIESNFGGRPPVPANISPAVMQNLSSAYTEGSPATPSKLPNPNLIQLSIEVFNLVENFTNAIRSSHDSSNFQQPNVRRIWRYNGQQSYKYLDRQSKANSKTEFE